MVSNVICSRDLSKTEHVAITLLIVGVCTSISLGYDCLGVVLELNVSHTHSANLCLFACVHLSMLMLCLFYLTGIFYVCRPGCSERHTSHLHYSIGVFPQTLPSPLVPLWKPDTHHIDNTGLICHDHRADHDGPVSSGLFTRSGDVLLCRCQCHRHCTTCVKGTLAR